MATKQTDGRAATGKESEPWTMAEPIRGWMDAADSKHVLRGLIFRKYISGAFEELQTAVLTDEDSVWNGDTYHAWRKAGDGYTHALGSCKSACLRDVRRHGNVLTPGRYVSVEQEQDEREPVNGKMQRLGAELYGMQATLVNAAAKEGLAALGLGGSRV